MCAEQGLGVEVYVIHKLLASSLQQSMLPEEELHAFCKLFQRVLSSGGYVTLLGTHLLEPKPMWEPLPPRPYLRLGYPSCRSLAEHQQRAA